jgi:hypothetical protein
MSRGMPETRQEMLRAGYQFLNTAECKGCKARIEWWKTTNGRKIPMNPAASDHAVMTAHFATCPKSDSFRLSTDKSAIAPNVPDQIGPEIRRLRTKHRARVAVIVTDAGVEAAWDTSIPAEDLRNDLISAANFVRGEIQKQEAKR